MWSTPHGGRRRCPRLCLSVSVSVSLSLCLFSSISSVLCVVELTNQRSDPTEIQWCDRAFGEGLAFEDARRAASFLPQGSGPIRWDYEDFPKSHAYGDLSIAIFALSEFGVDYQSFRAFVPQALIDVTSWIAHSCVRREGSGGFSTLRLNYTQTGDDPPDSEPHYMGVMISRRASRTRLPEASDWMDLAVRNRVFQGHTMWSWYSRGHTDGEGVWTSTAIEFHTIFSRWMGWQSRQSMPSCNGDRLSRQEAQQLQAKLPPDTQNLSLSADQPYLVTTDAPSDLGLSVISAQDVDLPWQAINNVVRLIVETCLYEAVRKHTGGNMTWHFPTADGESFSMTVSLVNHVATTMEGLGG